MRKSRQMGTSMSPNGAVGRTARESLVGDPRTQVVGSDPSLLVRFKNAQSKFSFGAFGLFFCMVAGGPVGGGGVRTTPPTKDNGDF